VGLIRDDTADIRVSINGTPFFDSWATYDGGDLTAQDAKTRTGNMGPQISAGGPNERGDITATIQFTDVVAGFHNQLEGMCGNARVAVSIQYLNRDKTPIPGAHFTRRGTLKSAQLPKSDANTSAVSFYTITVSADELAG
jgi:hypothetical protein